MFQSSGGVAGGGHQHSVDDGDGEGEEESSSSSPSQQVNQGHHNDELEEFRQQWKQEFSGQKSAVNKGQDDARASLPGETKRIDWTLQPWLSLSSVFY